MVQTPREKTREKRKLIILETFDECEVQHTNEIANKLGIVWPVADRLLQEMVEERRLFGDKVKGYSLKKETFYEKIKRIFQK